MRFFVAVLLVALAGCQLQGIEPLPPQPTGVVVAVGINGTIMRSLYYGDTAMGFKTQKFPGNVQVGADLLVKGELNQGRFAQIDAMASSVSQLNGFVQNGFLGNLYVRGTLYQKLGDQWSSLITNPFTATGGSINGIAYGSSTYVAVGGSGAATGRIIRSTDLGSTWGAYIANPFGNFVTTVCYGNNVFIGGSLIGEIAKSTDAGATWGATIANPFSAATVIYASVYVNGVFIMGGLDAPAAGRIARSTDNGATWGALIANPFGANGVFSMAAGKGIVVAAGGGGIIARSTDLGQTWTSMANPFGGTAIYNVTFGNDVFIAVGAGGKIGRSVDLGKTWSLVTNPFGATTIQSAAYFFGIFQAGSTAGGVSRSYDNGVTWGSLISTAFGANTIQGIAASSSNVIAVGINACMMSAGWKAAYSLVEPVPGEPSLGTPHHFPLSSTSSKNVVNAAAPPAAGAWSAAIDCSSLVPVGTKAVIVSVRLTGQQSTNSIIVYELSFSDNNSTTPSATTGHPHIGGTGYFGNNQGYLFVEEELIIPLSASMTFYTYCIAQTNVGTPKTYSATLKGYII